MVEAIGAATGRRRAEPAFHRAVDSIRVVSLLSYRARNPALLVAERLGIAAAETAYTTAGGNTPQSLVNRTALDIAAGRADLVVLAGAEAWRTRMQARKAGTRFEWPKAPEDAPPVVIGDELEMTHPAEAAKGIYLPVQVYPMFETAIRAAGGARLTITSRRRRAVVALQPGRRGQPARLDPRRRCRQTRSLT